MGVLHWTYDQTLDTPMPAIAAAIGAHNKHVNSVLKLVGSFLGVEFDEPSVQKEKLTPTLFRNLFGGRK